MNLEDANTIRELLKENDFTEINMMENPEEIDNFYTASEMARRIDIRLDNNMMNEALTSMGYKTYYNKIGLPSNPENSAFVLKYTENEDTEEKDYYIQCLWDKGEFDTINKSIMTNKNFESHKQELIEKNNITIRELLNSFKEIDDYVVLSVKKTGFNLKKDFVLYVAYSIFNKTDGLKNSGYILLNDDIDGEKTDRYLNKSETTGMSPYDYIKLDLPTMDDCNFRDLFLSRLDALRRLYSIVKGRYVVFYNEYEERFLNVLFEKEDIPYEYTLPSIKRKSLYFKDLIDWLEPKESFKLKDVYNRYKIVRQNGSGFQQDAVLLNEAIYKVLKKY